MIRYSFILLALVLPLTATAKLTVVASTADIAYFAGVVGGDQVEVTAIASPTADIHFVEVRPSYMVKVSRADIVFKVGLELDLWMDKIIDGSRNSSLKVIDCSQYVEPLEVPSFKADARYGDLHRFGNPHYWLGPQNVLPITQAIVEGLSAADPEHAELFEANRAEFLDVFEAGLKALQPKIDRLKGVKIVCYHNSWPYFMEYTGMNAVDFIEPFPGVTPSPSHIKDLHQLIDSHSIRLIGVEPYFDRRVPEKIAANTGASVITLYPSIGGRSKGESYVQWFEGNIDALLGGLQ
jgi:ABC-type Zn uptake system ZnuABC Zn-binding protein ZnuA